MNIDYCVNYLSMKIGIFGIFLIGIILGHALCKARWRKKRQ